MSKPSFKVVQILPDSKSTISHNVSKVNDDIQTLEFDDESDNEIENIPQIPEIKLPSAPRSKISTIPKFDIPKIEPQNISPPQNNNNNLDELLKLEREKLMNELKNKKIDKSEIQQNDNSSLWSKYNWLFSGAALVGGLFLYTLTNNKQSQNYDGPASTPTQFPKVLGNVK